MPFQTPPRARPPRIPVRAGAAVAAGHAVHLATCRPIIVSPSNQLQTLALVRN